MARPLKKGLDYFPHDTDAMNDEKLEIMQLLYGNDGYAFYFKMLERIYRSADLLLDVSDAETRLVMIKKCNVDEERFDKMLATALRHGLFDQNAFDEFGVVTSKGVIKRSEMVTKKRENMRERYQIKVSDAETREETMSETPQTKQNKTKQKETKQNETKTHYSERVSLSESEYQSLIENYGEAFTRDCIKLLENYKASSGKQYESDFHAMQSWVITRVTDQMNKPATQATTQKPAYKPPATEKPKMVMATQETLPNGVSKDEWEDWQDVARRLDEGRPPEA
jgi:hypothetical protein